MFVEKLGLGLRERENERMKGSPLLRFFIHYDLFIDIIVIFPFSLFSSMVEDVALFLVIRFS